MAVSNRLKQWGRLRSFGDMLVTPEAVLNTLTSRRALGTNVFNREWDLLVILDTCRVDALKAVVDEYDFVSSVSKVLSVGSSSPEWITKTFVNDYCDEISETVFIAGNSFTYRILEERKYPERGRPAWNTVDPGGFRYLEHAWKLKRELGELHPDGYANPEIITDRAIALGREQDFNRMIVHYSPPHAPYIADAIADGNRKLYTYEVEPFAALQNGIPKDRIWNAYLNNLRLCLDSVSILLRNIDAERAVLTADHGEAFGEFGMHGHRTALLSPYVKYVPWAPTSASDTEKYEPAYPAADDIETNGDNVEERLKGLGYLV